MNEPSTIILIHWRDAALVIELAAVQDELGDLHVSNNDVAGAAPFYRRAVEMLCSINPASMSDEQLVAAHNAVEAEIVFLLNHDRTGDAFSSAVQFAAIVQHVQAPNNEKLTGVTLAAIYRRASLSTLLKNDDLKKQSIQQADALTANVIHSHPGDAWCAVKLLAEMRNTETSAESQSYRNMQIRNAVSILQSATEEKVTPPADNECRQTDVVAVLRSVPEFATVLTSWESQQQITATQPMPTTQLAATDLDSITLAARNGTEITVHGQVAKLNWFANSSALSISLQQVPQSRFVFFVFSQMRVPLEAKLGGRLEDVLPGADLVVRGKPTFYKDVVELKINNPDQIVSFTRSATTQPKKDEEPVVNVVRGKITSAAWSPSGRVMSIELDGNDPSKPVLSIFRRNADAIIAALNSGEDLETFLRGRFVEVTGEPIDYPASVNSNYAGRKEIIINSASQIHVIQQLATQPATGPTTRPAK